MAGLASKPMMRDLTPAQVDQSVSLGPMDDWARNLKTKGDADPFNPQHAPAIQRVADAIRSGNISEEGVKNLATLTPKASFILYDALAEYKKASAQQQQISGVYSKYFKPEEQLPSDQYGPVRPATADYPGAITALTALGPPGAELAGKLEIQRKSMLEKPGGDKFEGAVLFDTQGNTYRATKEGKIVPVPVEGGARIAPPVYPFQTTDPVTGMPIQQVITKPEAARRAQAGTTTLGTTEAVGKQNIENIQKYKKNITGLEKTESTLSALDKFVETKGIQAGIGPVNATDRRTAETLHANVLAGLREIDDMGVLQPGELPFLERQIANPGSWKNIGQAEAIRAQIKTVRNRITKLKPILARQYGVAPMETLKETKGSSVKQQLLEELRKK